MKTGLKIPLTILLVSLLLPIGQAYAETIIQVGVVDLDLDNNKEEPHLLNLKQAAKTLNVQLELIQLPDARSHHLAEEGQLGGEAFPYDLPNRQASSMMKVNVPIEKTELWVWVHKSNSCLSDHRRLNQLKPVGVNGIPYFELFYQLSNVGHAKVQHAESMLEMLNRQRADYFPASKKAVAYLFNEVQRTDLKACFEHPYIEIQSYFYLNKQYQHLIEPFEQQLRKVIQQHTDDDTLK